MIDNLNDLNRLLLALETLNATRLRTPRRLLIRYLNGEVVYGQNPPFEPILEFAELVGCVSQNAKGFGLTQLGRELLFQNARKTYEFSDSQCPLVLRKCYLDGPFRAQAKTLVRKFVVNPKTGRLSWSAFDSEPLGEVEWVGNHLAQLGVFDRAGHLLLAAPAYNELLITFRDEGADFSEAQFRQVLKEKRLLGDIAEKFVVSWEQNRLKKSGYRVEASCVARISKRRVNAGYDIESFDAASKLLAHDRFIEVKGSGQPTVRFVWTPNEIKKAAELRAKYWVYFVGAIQRKTRTVTREPLTLQDPYSTLNPTSGFSLQPKGDVLVTASKAGNLLGAPERVRS
jgi:hypothetical protein